MEVQIFGTHKSADTRKALRFFSDRRIRTHFVDLRERAASRGELQRFAQKFGVTAMLDTASARYRDLGLAAGRYSDDWWLDTMSEEPLLLRQPLSRWKAKVAIGLAEAEWAAWIAADAAAP